MLGVITFLHKPPTMTNTVSYYSSFQCLEGGNKVAWNNAFLCLHGGPGYHSAGRASSNIRMNKMRCVAFPISNWPPNSPFCIHHSTHLQQTSSSQLLILFMSVVFCLPELLQQAFCPSPRAAPRYFRGLPITNHLQSAVKRILLKIN